MASARLLATAFVQYNGAEDRVSGNIRLRYNPSEGHDLYLVWNEVVNSDRFVSSGSGLASVLNPSSCGDAWMLRNGLMLPVPTLNGTGHVQIAPFTFRLPLSGSFRS